MLNLSRRKSLVTPYSKLPLQLGEQYTVIMESRKLPVEIATLEEQHSRASEEALRRFDSTLR